MVFELFQCVNGNLFDRQASAYARDQRKNRFLEYAGIPLLRVPSRQSWDVATIQQEVEREIAAAQTSRSFLGLQECELFSALREIWDQSFIFPRVSPRQAIRRDGWLSLDAYKTLQDEIVDFLLAHPKYLGTRLVIELDDGNVRHSGKIELLAQAKIPCLVVNSDSLDKTQLRQMVRQRLTS